ncbi:ABC-transporter ATP binding protein [Caballeronia peredens]|nr:ABC-transporter ATP binding protein [Caballeronia peredens]
MSHVVSLQNVSKYYKLDSVSVTALEDVTVRLRSGVLTVLSGPSGSGKTTLLNMIGGIDRPDKGRVVIDGQDIGALPDDALSDFRARHVGHVFQNFNLLPVLTAAENVEYPLWKSGLPARERTRRVADALDAVGLAQKMQRNPGQLSGGERQRVAIARALVREPAVVLADEPTANLDSQTGAAIIELMRHLQQSRGVSFIVSSHDPQMQAAADDTVRILDGRVVEHRHEQEALAI